MNKYLPFILPEEIFRLNSASPYHAFILKSNIEKFLKEANIQNTVKNALSYGSKFRYFDTKKMDEDVLFVRSIEDAMVIGERMSDNKIIKTPLESISLSEQILEPNEEKREELDGFEAQHLEKVAFSSRNQGRTYIKGSILLLGYLVRHSNSTSKIRLLGGDLITTDWYHHNLYKPTKKELELFERVESDEYFIQKELNRTVDLIRELSQDMDLDVNANISKLKRLLTVRGCTSSNIDEAIKLIQNS